MSDNSYDSYWSQLAINNVRKLEPTARQFVPIILNSADRKSSQTAFETSEQLWQRPLILFLFKFAVHRDFDVTDDVLKLQRGVHHFINPIRKWIISKDTDIKGGNYVIDVTAIWTMKQNTGWPTARHY